MVTKNKNISFIIPNYNGADLLKKNLPKVIAACQVSTVNCQEIIVVDDGSTDNSCEVVETISRKFAKNSRHSRGLVLELISQPKNRGFSSTVNRGVKEAQGDIVVLLNTDVYPEKGFLEAVLPHFDDPQVFAVGFMDKSIEGDKIVLRGRGIGWWQKGFYVHKRGEVNQKETAWVSGGSGAFRRSIFLKLGGFAEIYNPFYWEDIDLSYQAVKAGYKLMFEPKAKVIHEHQEGAIKKRYSERAIKFFSYRNQFLFVWRNANLKQWLSHLFWLPYHLIFTSFKSQGIFLAAWFGAMIRFLKFSQKT